MRKLHESPYTSYMWPAISVHIIQASASGPSDAALRTKTSGTFYALLLVHSIGSSLASSFNGQPYISKSQAMST